MKIANWTRDALRKVSPWLEEQIDRMVAVLQAWSKKEHHDDGTHGNLTADRLRLDAGTSSVPSLAWADDIDTGWYRDATSGGWFLVFGGAPGFQLLSGQVRLEAGGTAASPLLVFIGSTTTGWYRFASTTWGFSANGNQVLSLGTAGLTMVNAFDIVLGTGTGTKIGTATTQKLGFWNATPIVQPSSTGETTGWTSGGGSAATSTDTYTGNSGTKAYTINDVVKALKAAGILAAS